MEDKFPKDDKIHRFLWNFLSEIISIGSSGDTLKNNLQNLLLAIIPSQFLTTSSSLCIPSNTVSQQLVDSHNKFNNTKKSITQDTPLLNASSSITSESIASSLFHNLEFSKAMSLIGLSLSRNQTSPLTQI